MTIHGIRYEFQEWVTQAHPRLERGWCEKTQRYRDPKTDSFWRVWLAATMKNWTNK